MTRFTVSSSQTAVYEDDSMETASCWWARRLTVTKWFRQVSTGESRAIARVTTRLTSLMLARSQASKIQAASGVPEVGEALSAANILAFDSKMPVAMSCENYLTRIVVYGQIRGYRDRKLTKV
jgi:hypothetical protein